LDDLGDTAAAVSFGRDGALVAASNYRGDIVLWDWQADRVERRLSAEQRIDTLALSPSGDMLAAAGQGIHPKLWRLESQGAPMELFGQSGYFHTLDFTGDGRRLVSAASDGASGIWDTESGEMFSRLPGYTGRMMWAAFSEKRQALFTAGETAGPNALRRWPAAPWDVSSFKAASSAVRARRNETQPSIPATGEVYVAASPERWQAALEVLQRILGRAGETAAAAGRSEALALAGIGIAPGTKILAIGGIPVAEPAAATALAATEPPVIQIQESGTESSLRIRLHEPVSEAVTITFAQAEAVELLRGAEFFLSFRNEGITQLTQEYWMQLTGSPDPPEGHCGGAWFNAPLESADRDDMRKFGLGAGDEIVRVDGTCVEGLAGLRQAITALRERAESAEAPFSFALEVHRGEFQRTTITYSITI
jgi:hypothetical protein